MRRFAPRAPLLALTAVVIYAALRLADPHQRWAAIPVGGDRVEHAAVAYLLVMFSFVGFPRLPLWLPATGLIAFGVLVEAAQALPGAVGSPQPGDVLANAVGAVAATLPAWLARRRYQAAERPRTQLR